MVSHVIYEVFCYLATRVAKIQERWPHSNRLSRCYIIHLIICGLWLIVHYPNIRLLSLLIDRPSYSWFPTSVIDQPRGRSRERPTLSQVCFFFDKFPSDLKASVAPYEYKLSKSMWKGVVLFWFYTQQHKLCTAYSTNDCRGKRIAIY